MNADSRILWNVALEPGQIACLGGDGRHDEIAVPGLPCDGHVSLYAATFIEPLSVDDPADGNGDIICADPVESFLRVRTLNHEFGEGRLVEQADRFADRAMFVGGKRKPILPPIAISVLRRLSVGRVPVWAFPACGLAKAGTRRFEPIMQHGTPRPTRRFRLPKRPMHGVEQAQGLCRPIASRRGSSETASSGGCRPPTDPWADARRQSNRTRPYPRP